MTSFKTSFKKIVGEVKEQRKKMLNQFGELDEPRNRNKLPNPSKGPVNPVHRDDIYSYYSVEGMCFCIGCSMNIIFIWLFLQTVSMFQSFSFKTRKENESDEKEYTDVSVLEELNEIANTKDEDLEAVLEDGYDHFDEDYTQVKYRDQQVPQPSAGIGAQEREFTKSQLSRIGYFEQLLNFSQKNLPKNLDWSDWHRDREEIIQQQLEEREAVVSRRNRSHFNYSFIGTIFSTSRL